MRRARLPWSTRRHRSATAPSSRGRAKYITGAGVAALFALALVPACGSAHIPARPSAGAAKSLTAGTAAKTTKTKTSAATNTAARSAAPVGRYVALGDSYTAGPLIPEQTGTPAGCLRSNHDYPSLVAAGLHPSSFRDISCSGAVTGDMTGSQSVTIGTNPPQFSALNAATSLVTVQISGNDIGFINIVETCGELSITSPAGAPCKAHYTSGGTDQLAEAIQKTAPKVAGVLLGIHQHSPHARVLLVGYPVILPNAGYGCWPVVPIAYGDVPYLRGVELKLNQMLANEAAANGATYVNTYTGSIGHDVCRSPGVKWVEGLVPTSAAAPFHPNELGEQAMARQVLAALG
jgi:lysophospholipase L1-like esterase